MRYAVGAWVLSVALAGVVSCAGWRRNVSYKADVDHVLAEYSNRRATIPAPASAEPKPWKLGQWALYKRRQGDELGYKMWSVVAEDGCGIWIEEVRVAYDHHWQWLMCFRSSPAMPTDTAEALNRLQVVITRWNDGQPTVYDFRDGSSSEPKSNFEGVVAHTFFPSWRRKEELSPEDVDVPAGHFLQAIRTRQTSADGSLDVLDWFHSDVPFDGTIKEVESHGQLDFELLAYGDQGVNSVLPELTKDLVAAKEPGRRSRIFLAIGLATGWLSGHGSEATSGAQGLDAFYGFRVAPKIDVGWKILFVDVARYAPDPTFTQSALLAGVGIRWAPFGPARARYPNLPGASALYVQGEAGYAQLDLSMMNSSTTIGRGFGAGLSVGWLGIQAQDWVAGFQVSDHVSFFNSGEGVRDTFAVTGFMQLHLPWPGM